MKNYGYDIFIHPVAGFESRHTKNSGETAHPSQAQRSFVIAIITVVKRTGVRTHVLISESTVSICSARPRA